MKDALNRIVLQTSCGSITCVFPPCVPAIELRGFYKLLLEAAKVGRKSAAIRPARKP